ncbi:hypothetical protein ABT040_17115 [Streptomyces sp. NPDC002688]|uniref:hypothetical protein n=1 Tax=Streptomyces sp. NPDC002688 TaxID=3154423 RepID=UPI00332867F2
MIMRRKDEGGEVQDGMDAALDALYTTAPPDFVARREQLAVAARTAGRADDARLIHAARRPTLAAWASNLLLRSEPEESLRFLELGQALRAAYQDLDTDAVKELSERRRQIVSALSRQAAQLARTAGHQLSNAAEREVESTLQAVLTDESAASQWGTGRLESALKPPSSLPVAPPLASGTRRKPPGSTPAPASSRTAAKDEGAARRRRQQELARARKAAEAAARDLRELQAARTDADTLLQRARDRHGKARERLSTVEGELKQARERLQRAEEDRQDAETRDAAAADAVAAAELAVHEADQEVHRLGSSNA